MEKYCELLKPFSIGNMTVKNKIVMSPMGPNDGNIDGTIGDSSIDYYTERAKGGTGMIITGALMLAASELINCLDGLVTENYAVHKLATLCKSVHRYNTKIIAQISVGTGRNGHPNENGEPLYSSSVLPLADDPTQMTRPMTVEEIKDFVKRYRKAAEIAKKAGFDGIEIHAHVGYLLDQFMSSCWNKREDEYGGSIENRLRFPLELVQAIKEVNGKDYPVLYRMALCHLFEGGRTIEEGIELIKALEAGGVDALDLDAGSYENLDYVFPPTYLGDACLAFVAQPALDAVDIPILVSGNNTPETGLELIKKGAIPMFGRSLIADPYFGKKLLENRREDIRPCIRCNEKCIGNPFFYNRKLGCAINVEANDEARFKLEPVTSKKNIVVIGAGPAGLEAARVLSLRGHEVTVFEKEDHIGGQIAAAATPSFKSPLRNLIKWFEIQLEKQNVTINLSTEITPDDPRLEEYDYIVVAVGATTFAPKLPGIDGANVVDILEAHFNKELVKGDNIVICGGGLSGCDYALELALDEKKTNVTIVEMQDEVAKDVNLINKISLLTKLAGNGVKMLTGTKVLSFDETGVLVEKSSGTEHIAADTIITAFGTKKRADFVNAIQEKYYTKAHVIGDCDSVSNVGNAVTTGYFVGSVLE